MATPKTPSTPAAQLLASTPQPGTWIHPKFNEIARRKNASTFGEKHMHRIIYNIVGLLAMFVGEKLLKAYIPSLFLALRPLNPYPTWLFRLTAFVLIYNIGTACLPLIRRPDDISDIPLTPAQRRLLGLPPSDTPPPPGSTYVTPPRYARSRTNSPAGSPLSGSPLSGKGVSAAVTGSGGRASPLQGGSPASGTPGRNNSPFSPSASPLLHKTLGGGLGTRRSGSFGATANSVFAGDESLSGIASPSPKNGKASVGLNSRWLYEKGRGSGGNGRLFS